jgi:hypothetical protein
LKLLVQLIKNYSNFLFWYFFSFQQKRPVREKVISVDFSNFGAERNYAQVLFSLSNAGYKIILKHRFSFIANLREFSCQIASLPGLNLAVNNKKIKNAIHLCDNNKHCERQINQKQVLFCDDILLNGNPRYKSSLFPYPMQPRIYFNNWHSQLKSLRGVKRRMKIFFSGNQNRKHYDSAKFRYFFSDKMTRVSIIDTLVSELNPEELFLLRGLEEVNYFQYENKFVLSQWERKSLKEIISKRTTNEHWLDFLAYSDFFLACPGYIQPMCHNVIEAMGVGAIPIIEHPEMFFPPLVDGQNCLAFSGQAELLVKIRLALSLPEEKVNQLRKNVVKYYDDYLSPEAICKKIESVGVGETTFYVNTDYFFEKKYPF